MPLTTVRSYRFVQPSSFRSRRSMHASPILVTQSAAMATDSGLRHDLQVLVCRLHFATMGPRGSSFSDGAIVGDSSTSSLPILVK